jgi:phosphoglucomutase
LVINVPRLVTAYFTERPDPGDPSQRVCFGTSGHRGVSTLCSFNEAHILAITQAVVEYRRSKGVGGPLFLGKDTHALSEAALATTVEVLAGNGVEMMVQREMGHTPTPVISHAILSYNRTHRDAPADGIVITPSHNPPDNGGFKYNPIHGGPAESEATKQIEERANALLADGNQGVRRIKGCKALRASTLHLHDYIEPYVADLGNALDLEAVRAAGLSIGVDPLGGASLCYWGPIADRYGLKMEIANRRVDPTFSFMSVDHDGKVRMDCSSPYAMSGLIGMKERYDVAFGTDPDADRHGIVTRAGLVNPNHYLAAAIWYLFQNRPGWPKSAAVGKTLVSSNMIDRVAALVGRRLSEVPVGFKWFVQGLLDGSYGFGGEESAGASFLRRDGTVWTTDKDGILLGLLAAEMTAKTGKDPSMIYGDLVSRLGEPVYERLDVAATPQQKRALGAIESSKITAQTLAGEPILAKLIRAPGNGAPIGGIKVVTENGWFAARPSGTEDVYKIYAESFKGRDHLARIQGEARAMVAAAFQAAGV